MTSQGLKLSVATLAIAAASASGLLALGASEASAATIAHAQTSMQRHDECCERGSHSWGSSRDRSRNHNRNHIRNRQWQWQRQHQHQHQSLILNLSFPDRENGAQDNVGQGLQLEP